MQHLRSTLSSALAITGLGLFSTAAQAWPQLLPSQHLEDYAQTLLAHDKRECRDVVHLDKKTDGRLVVDCFSQNQLRDLRYVILPENSEALRREQAKRIALVSNLPTKNVEYPRMAKAPLRPTASASEATWNLYATQFIQQTRHVCERAVYTMPWDDGTFEVLCTSDYSRELIRYRMEPELGIDTGSVQRIR